MNLTQLAQFESRLNEMYAKAKKNWSNAYSDAEENREYGRMSALENVFDCLEELKKGE